MDINITIGIIGGFGIIVILIYAESKGVFGRKY